MNTDKAYAEKISSEYAPKETRKVVALRKLDTFSVRKIKVLKRFDSLRGGNTGTPATI